MGKSRSTQRRGEAYSILAGTPEKNETTWGNSRRRVNNIKICITYKRGEGMNWIQLAYGGVYWWFLQTQ